MPDAAALQAAARAGAGAADTQPQRAPTLSEDATAADLAAMLDDNIDLGDSVDDLDADAPIEIVEAEKSDELDERALPGNGHLRGQDLQAEAKAETEADAEAEPALLASAGSEANATTASDASVPAPAASPADAAAGAADADSSAGAEVESEAEAEFVLVDAPD